MDLVAVDWFKDTRRMDHVARRKGCAAQVSLLWLPPFLDVGISLFVGETMAQAVGIIATVVARKIGVVMRQRIVNLSVSSKGFCFAALNILLSYLSLSLCIFPPG